jgi:phosphoribosylformylglycinamidine cyclo-ligase
MSRYEEAGVNIKKGEEAVERIKAHLRSTFVPGVVGDVGVFAGAFRLPGGGGQILSPRSTASGPSSRWRSFDRHDTVACDLVCHSANDILVHGGRPLFFSTTSRWCARARARGAVVAGLARGCREVGSRLIGARPRRCRGSTEKGLRSRERSSIVRVVAGGRIARRARDALLGRDVGLYTNGYSLANDPLTAEARARIRCPGAGTVGDVLLNSHPGTAARWRRRARRATSAPWPTSREEASRQSDSRSSRARAEIGPLLACPRRLRAR